jgi:hypothetical protein
MITGGQPGDVVIERATMAEWTILYYDAGYKVATCERSEGHRNIVRAIHAEELQPCELRRPRRSAAVNPMV